MGTTDKEPGAYKGWGWDTEVCLESELLFHKWPTKFAQRSTDLTQSLVGKTVFKSKTFEVFRSLTHMRNSAPLGHNSCADNKRKELKQTSPERSVK